MKGLGDIFLCKKEDGRWNKVESIDKVNTKDMDSEPYISPDNRLLYFASTRKGGKGKADIWMAKKLIISKYCFLCPLYLYFSFN